MPIKILKKSFAEHRTIDSITTSIQLQMTWQDYYNGFGELVVGADETDIINSNYILPFEGDSYGIFFQTNYLSSLVLTDITMEPTTARVFTNPVDLTKQDLDKEVVITYTWSNQGANDTKRVDEASSWKISYETTLEVIGLDNYVGSVAGTKFYWPDKYLTVLNPQVVLTKLDSDGNEEEVGSPTYGLYNTESTAIKKRYIDSIREEIPVVQKRIPKTTCTVRAYSRDVKGFELTQLIGKVNSVDFLEFVYTRKEEALIAKNKLPGYNANDWININDAGLWMFIDWEMEDMGNGFFQYDFTFEFDGIGWNKYADADVTIDILLYKKENFYEKIFLGMDQVLPNNRDTR